MTSDYYNNMIMKNQKIRKFLGNMPNQSSKFRKTNCFERNDDTRGTHGTNGQIKCKTVMLK